MPRTLLLRSSGMTSAESTWMGINDGTLEELEEFGRWPLLKLGAELIDLRSNITKQSSGVLVMCGKFHAYANNTVAHDQLLTGVSKSIIELCYLHIDSD